MEASEQATAIARPAFSSEPSDTPIFGCYVRRSVCKFFSSIGTLLACILLLPHRLAYYGWSARQQVACSKRGNLILFY